MIREFARHIKTSIILMIAFTMITGIIYPLIITGIAQLFFPWQANGSLLKVNDKVIGSALVGQLFESPAYFWGRPSATKPFPYNAAASSGSNLSTTNKILLAQVEERVKLIRQFPPQNTFIPVDLVTSSASGLDPDISPQAAYFQVPRIAKSRNISIATLQMLIQNQIINRSFSLLGEPRVNVLQLNIALDNLKST